MTQIYAEYYRRSRLTGRWTEEVLGRSGPVMAWLTTDAERRQAVRDHRPRHAKFDRRAGREVDVVRGRMVRTYSADAGLGLPPGSGYGFSDSDTDQDGVVGCQVRLVLA